MPGPTPTPTPTPSWETRGLGTAGIRITWRHLHSCLAGGAGCWLGPQLCCQLERRPGDFSLYYLGMGWLASSWPGSIPREQSANFITFYNLALEDT